MATNRGGRRPGAGRPKGRFDGDTQAKNAALKEFRRRVATHADALFNAQYRLAVGVTYVYKIELTANNKENHVLVTDPDEIKRYLDGNVEGVYYISTEKPDNKAADSLLDRAFGRPQQSIDLSSDPERPIIPQRNLDALSKSELRQLRDILTRITPAVSEGSGDGAGESKPN